MLSHVWNRLGMASGQRAKLGCRQAGSLALVFAILYICKYIMSPVVMTLLYGYSWSSTSRLNERHGQEGSSCPF